MVARNFPQPQDLIPFGEVPSILPKRRMGRRLHIATLYRWSGQGVCGVRLKCCCIGSQRATTKAWLDEFFASVAAAKLNTPAPASDAVVLRQNQIAKAEAALSAARI